jgi:iron complex outermembrane receptor protein
MSLKSLLVITGHFLFLITGKTQTITGTIFDASTGNPLPGASIAVSQKKNGTISNQDGTYIIRGLEPGEYTIKCSFVGYSPEEKNIEITDQPIRVNIELNPFNRQISEVVIEGEITGPVRRAGDALFTGSAITRKGIKLMGASASNSVYNALSIMPGITIEGHDAYGLSDKNVRIRGIRSTFSGMTIEGFPNYGIMPIGARDDIYDMENINSVSVYKGAAPADLGTATGSKGGVIELKYKRPADSLQVDLQQSAGTSAYLRSFGRVDFGKLTNSTRAFLSLSRTSADKWKGNGTLGPRYNTALGITQKAGPDTKIELFANYNTIDRHHFKKLTYPEASDIETNYKNDFYGTLSGSPDQDINYYGYNQGMYTNRDIMVLLSHNFAPFARFNMKAYYSAEDADYNESIKRGTNNFVYNRVRDINRAGIIPEMRGWIEGIDYTLGYWHEIADNNAYVYNSHITPDGLQPIGYAFYTVNNKNSKVHSPYLKLAHTFNGFKLQAGLKYFYYREPAADRFTSESPNKLSENPDPNIHTEAMKYQSWLPSIGVGYEFNKHLQAYLNYGKNYMRPYMYNPIISLYVNNKEDFAANNMTLQSIFDEWTMETSDNIDLGIRFSNESITFSPSFFYAKHHDVLASAYNPEVGVNYFRNVGRLTAYGADIECYLKPVENLSIFVNPTVNEMSYDKNLVRNDETINIKGNQSPATPKFSLKTGAIVSTNKLNTSLMVKHIGKRYGDATNLEEIDAYTLADFRIRYAIPAPIFLNSLYTSLEVKNILNTRYVGAINASNDSNKGSAMYYAGMPRSIVASVEINF